MTDARTQPLKLAVVGHTNVGKTSLLRTLTRDVGFGEVSHRPSTTRHVEGARLSVDGEPLLELYDTPGLEDAIALLDYIERLERPGERLDGPARLLIACDPRRSPDRGSLALIGELARSAAATRIWLLPPPPGEALDSARLSDWHRALEHLQLSYSDSASFSWLEHGHD